MLVLRSLLGRTKQSLHQLINDKRKEYPTTVSYFYYYSYVLVNLQSFSQDFYFLIKLLRFLIFTISNDLKLQSRNILTYPVA